MIGNGSAGPHDCIFCAIVAGEAPCRLIDEDDYTISFLDIAPVAVGHTLVIPKRHATDLHDIKQAELAVVTVAAQRVAGLLTGRLGADGVNLFNCCGVAAWQSVFHFHLHVIPRFDGDHPLPSINRTTTDADLDALHTRITGDDTRSINL